VVIGCVRAVLLRPTGGLLLIRRTWAGATPFTPFWVFPAGTSNGTIRARAALAREMRQQTGAEPQITGVRHVPADAHRRQYFYPACIRSWSEADRTGFGVR
jgi:ADP-ribose pyrophosphatase YjhB (NUDIX family)